MDFRGIPVRTIGPGTQPEEQDGKTLSYIDMPKDMWTYKPPRLPEPEVLANLAAAKETMQWLRDALATYRRGSEPLLANLTALDRDSREIVNQILGEGEVSITCDGPLRACTQESVLAGVWRTLYIDQVDRVVYDLLEVADVPHYVRDHEAQCREIKIEPKQAPSDVTNALSILVELESYRQQYTTGQQPKVINLSLLPLADADLLYLDEQLGHGPVDILSRSYGKCQVSATLVPNVWWVRYYNSMSTLILNTLEVVDVPQVACAASEDLRDSAERLDDILTPYWPAVA
jgi:hydrogenase-1 operon protein HyaF